MPYYNTQLVDRNHRVNTRLSPFSQIIYSLSDVNQELMKSIVDQRRVMAHLN